MLRWADDPQFHKSWNVGTLDTPEHLRFLTLQEAIDDGDVPGTLAAVLTILEAADIDRATSEVIQRRLKEESDELDQR